MVNYILGRKAVSVKATPGHTKTLQTLILDDRTCLCDSPGLVFPRVDIGLAEQIIGGLVPLPVVREPYSAVRWLAELRDAGAERWNEARDEPMAPHQDRALAGALATSLASALKIPPLPDFDPEVLELTGSEDLLSESVVAHVAVPRVAKWVHPRWRPDSHTAGQTILSLVLEGRLPCAAPPPTGAPSSANIGADGQPVEADKYRDDDDTGARDDVSEASEHSDDDADDVEAFNPFRALGIDAEGDANRWRRYVRRGLVGFARNDGKGTAAS